MDMNKVEYDLKTLGRYSLEVRYRDLKDGRGERVSHNNS